MRNLLAYLEVEGEVVEKLVACNQELLAEWRKVESKIAYYIQKAKKFELEKLLQKTLEKENLLLNQIKEILDKVQNEQEDIKQKTTKEPVIFINNEQNIIKQNQMINICFILIPIKSTIIGLKIKHQRLYFHRI